MREKWERFKESLFEEKTMTKKEWLLTIAVAVLAGIAAGMLTSPRKNVMIASHNGNYTEESKEAISGTEE